ncbi:hypothetical protein PG999_007319 [Apiospora kogelbergensis]|uniref:RRM domain-containing protein n=1 Tax=Apiospora kogelbergensis TaxID=1337665 RepID=A0AAW0QXY8_9PEZI
MGNDEVQAKRHDLKTQRSHQVQAFRSQLHEPRTFDELHQFAAEDTTGFVTVDFDSWRQSPTELSELGFTYVPPLAQLDPPQKLDTEDWSAEHHHTRAVARTFLQSHSIRVKGRPRGDRDRESYWYGPSKFVEPDEVEEEALKIIRSFKSEAGTPCLVGFSIGYELNVLFVTYPRLRDEFSTIVDLQLVVRDLCCMDTYPSLRNTLIAFGLGCMKPRDPLRRLCAGNDAVRIALLLVNMLRLPTPPRPSMPTIENLGPEGKKREYSWRWNRAFRSRQFWNGGRPMPKELFPYTVMLMPRAEMGHKRLEFPFSAEGLSNYFKQYSPIASGISSQAKSIRYSKPRFGYLSFGSLESLDRFVEVVNKKVIEGRLWVVFSQYDPSIRPACSLEEHHRNIREDQMAQKEVKQEQRQEQRQNKQEVFDDAADEDIGGSIDTMFAS